MDKINIKLTKKQAKKVLKGLPTEIKKLKFEYVNTPTTDKESCEDILNKINILNKLKKDLEIFLNMNLRYRFKIKFVKGKSKYIKNIDAISEKEVIEKATKLTDGHFKVEILKKTKILKM